MGWWEESINNNVKLKVTTVHQNRTNFYATEWEIEASGNCDLIVVSNIGGSFYFDFWSSHGFSDCKITIKNKYKQYNSNGVLISEQAEWRENTYNISNSSYITYSNMNNYVDDSSSDGLGEYLKFSDFLDNFTETNYNDFIAENPIRYATYRVGNLNGIDNGLICSDASVFSESGRIFFTASASNYLNRPVTGDFKEVSKNITNYSLNSWYDYNNTVVNANISNTFRYDIIPYLIDDFEKYKDGDGKPFYAENIVTNIRYDGTKKASLVINHKFNLKEFMNFEEETTIYQIPGFFINLAVNIQTVNPVSGESVNVYNLHKIDLPRDGFTGNADVDKEGKSKSFTYTYGDLVKKCNNEILGLPMKISVSILQFADSSDPFPYVVYESPINPNPDMFTEQHLGAENTTLYFNTNAITWDGYNGSDDGNNSSDDGKNDDKGDKSGGTGSGQGTHNVLTTTYVSNATRLQSLGDFLWSSSFLDNILLVNNNPIENVISVKMFPFTLPTGAESTIVLGNVNTEVPTNKLPDNYNYYHVYGSVKVPSYYNSFMDYAPFTRILLYLPFYGTLELDNSLIIDRTLKIAYIVDVVTGASTIDIYADDSLINVISCQVGIDIPITSSNRAQVESAILSNTLTSAVSGASVGGGIGAVVGGVGGALLSAGHCKYNTQTSGTPSSATELYNVSVPMLIIDRPKYREISGFAHNKGKMCMLTKKLSDVSGFSIFDKNIDLSGIGCTETEMEMIRDLLSTGVYL